MGGRPLSRDPGRLWRPAPSLAVLRSEIDAAFPRRSTASDGFIGDQLHQARKSDHNPDQYGYVRAWDVTHDAFLGPSLVDLAAFLRDVGATGSQRLALGGYVIFDRKMASDRSEWQWVTYKGENPHVTHLHLSVSRLPEFYKIARPWHVAEALERRRQQRLEPRP